MLKQLIHIHIFQLIFVIGSPHTIHYILSRAGIGVDNVDIPAATAAGVIVMNTPFGNSITTAEHAIALMFALARQIPEANASIDTRGVQSRAARV